jgi:hypothetical protein
MMCTAEKIEFLGDFTQSFTHVAIYGDWTWKLYCLWVGMAALFLGVPRFLMLPTTIL